MLGNEPGKPFLEYCYRRLAASAGGEASFHDSALSMDKWYYGKRHKTSFASVSGAAVGMENGTEEVARVGAYGAVNL